MGTYPGSNFKFCFLNREFSTGRGLTGTETKYPKKDPGKVLAENESLTYNLNSWQVNNFFII